MPTVQSVDVSFRGTENISREAVMAHIKLHDGVEYDQNLVDQSIRSLYQTGLYDFIEVKRDLLPGDKIALTFIVTPKYRVTSLTFQGNEHLSSRKLKKDIDTKVGGVLNEVTVKRDADKIFDLYQKKGYSDVEVQYFIDKDSSTGEGAVRFEIIEGPRMHISKIKFVGNEHIKSKKLIKVMQTRTWNILSWISGTGRFREDEFSEDLDRLVDYYKDQGYLDVYIPPYEVTFEYPKPDSMVIVIHIDEGRQYHIGNITVSGNTLYPTERLMEVLTIKPGDVFSPSKVDKNAEDLKDFYGQYGYLDTVIRAERVPDLQSGDIGLNFSIRESEQFHLESVHIDGNTKTRFNVILRELALQPGDIFDLVRMKNSQTRLQNTRYFDEVILSPEETNIPGRRNMKITVKEARTGSFNFGLAFSSVENAVAFAELSQSNFDLFNYRNRFQGAGEKFRLRLALGTKSNEVTLHYEKPWLYDRKLTFGFEAFRRETDYVSTVYNEMRYGFEFYFSKRLIELIDGRIFYRLEEARIFDVSGDASTVIKSQEGTTTISKVGISLSRDTRDSLINPTRGSRLGFLTEVAGLGGNVDYIRVEGAAGRWWPTFEAGNQVFSLIGRTGTLTPYNGKSIPFFEKYFLGGPYNLRGYKYRDVGPRDSSGEVIGGDTMAYGSAEYSVEIIEPIRIAGFYDGGFVNSSDWDWSTDDYQHDLGMGLRIFIFGAPLRLDFAYPLNVMGGQHRKWNFNFSFGTVF
ncbi:MAG: outer membrane protein assembly factor BamA [Opitutales bacterium]